MKIHCFVRIHLRTSGFSALPSLATSVAAALGQVNSHQSAMLAAALAMTFLQPASLPDLGIIPAPKHIERKTGEWILPKRLTLSFAQVQNGDEKDLSSLARQLLSRPVTKTAAEADLAFEVDKELGGSEAYTLDVKPNGATIKAGSERGLFWGLQSLATITTLGKTPSVYIQDSPRFAWRGAMIDDCRHFMGVKTVKQFIDVMARFKLNTLHWHLTEDQGWRIEIKKHPQLTKVGAWRIEPDGSKHGGFYTQEQIKEIVAYAGARGIEVVPEIEMPGHCSAALASYPDLGCRRAKFPVPNTHGVFTDVYCVGRESTFEFLEDVLNEVAALFPSRYLHIGGDEVPTTNWEECPDCQKRIKDEGIEDVHKLQSWVMKRIKRHLVKLDKTMIGWDEIMEGGLAPGAIVQIWRGMDQLPKAEAAKAKVILSPGDFLYFDRRADSLTLSNVMSFAKVLESLNADRLENILGVEAPLWSERITTANIFPIFMPRGMALAELGWNGSSARQPELEAKIPSALAWLESKKISYGPADKNLMTVKVAADTARGVGVVTAEAGVAGAVLRYSLNGKTPTASSPAFEGSFDFPIGSQVRVAPFMQGRRFEEPWGCGSISHLAYGAKASFQPEAHRSYTASGPSTLVDGLLGSESHHDRLWLGWVGADVIISTDLGEPKTIKEAGIRCMHSMRAWIMLPKEVKVEGSLDGVSYFPIGTATHSVPDRESSIVLQWMTVKTQPVQVRHLRITAVNYGKLPAWHLGAGGESFIFADEVAVKS